MTKKTTMGTIARERGLSPPMLIKTDVNLCVLVIFTILQPTEPVIEDMYNVSSRVFNSYLLWSKFSRNMKSGSSRLELTL